MPAFSPASSEADRQQLYTTQTQLRIEGRLTFDRLSEEIPGTRSPGQTGHYRNTIFPDPSVLETGPVPRTLYELVKQVTDEIPTAPALGFLPVLSPAGAVPVVYASAFEYISYGELETARLEVGSALMGLYRDGVLGQPDEIERVDPSAGPEQGWAVGIWSNNRPEWQMVDMATQAFGLVSTALYDTLGPTTTVYVANHARPPVLFVTLAHLTSTLSILPECPSVKLVVSLDPLTPAEAALVRKWGESVGVRVMGFDELRAVGREKAIGPMPPRPENVATLCYTSGTTGNPKGAILTHRTMTTAVLANAYGSDFELRGTVELSYLPLAHIYARFCDLLVVLVRGTACFSTGDATRLLTDVALSRPAFFPSVPRALNKIYAAIMAQATSGSLKGKLLKHAIDTKVANFRKDGSVTHAVYDRVVFSKVQALMGGNLRYHTSGSAPIAKEVFETLKVAFAVDSVEGWGMTETVGTGAVGWPTDPGATGTIGAPRLCNVFKLVDVPEMGYLSTDEPPRGELCVQGSNVFSGYYKDEANTREALDRDGWLHTGDVCTVDGAGRFKIIDRKKNLVKMAQGEYVAVETVENVYMVVPLFSSFYLHCDPLESYPVAIGVVDVPQTLAFLRKTSRWPTVRSEADVERLVEDRAGEGEGRRLRDEVVDVLRKHGRDKKLQGYELVKGIHLTTAPFAPDLITPSFKFKRQAVRQAFEPALAQAYAEAAEPASEGRPAKARL